MAAAQSDPDKFYHFMKLIRNTSNVIGIDLLRNNYKINARIVTITSMTVFFIISFVVMVFEFKHTFYTLVEGFTLSVLAIQVQNFLQFKLIQSTNKSLYKKRVLQNCTRLWRINNFTRRHTIVF